MEHQGIKGIRRKASKIKGNLYITTIIEKILLSYFLGSSKFATISPLETQYIASLPRLLKPVFL